MVPKFTLERVLRTLKTTLLPNQEKLNKSANMLFSKWKHRSQMGFSTIIALGIIKQTFNYKNNAETVVPIVQ